MKTRLLLTASFAVAMTWLATVPEADAARRWRRTRTTSNNYYSQPNTLRAWQQARRPSRGPISYSGVSRAEQDFWRRRDAWYDHAFNGFRPEDFR